MKLSVFSLQSSEKNKGFTLVELMVVISIIAILATIGLTVYTQAQRSARDAKRSQDLQEIQKAMEQYYAIHHDYSTATNIYSIAGTDPISGYFSADAVPADPVGGGHYPNWVSNTPSNSYRICADLEVNTSGNRGSITTPSAMTATSPLSDGGHGWYCIGSLSE